MASPPRWRRELPERRRGAAAAPALGRPPAVGLHDLRDAIAWYDNVPLALLAPLRGRCRRCGADPVALPGVELLTALLVAACVLAFGAHAEALVAAFFCAVLVVISAIDIEHRIVPNRIVLPAPRRARRADAAHPSPEWPLAALGAALLPLPAALVYPAGMGMGDVKLALLLGAMLGRTSRSALMVGMLAALVPASCSSRGRRGGAQDGAPFAPFLALGGDRGALLGRRRARRVPEPSLRGRQCSSGYRRPCRYLVRGI